MRKKYLILWVALVAIVLSPVYIQKSSAKELPILSITKRVSKPIVKVNEWFTVIIEVDNIGESTAYNISIRDHELPSWGFQVQGQTSGSWDELKPNQKVILAYNVSIRNSAIYNVSLGRAIVQYYDYEGEFYEISSEEAFVLVYLSTSEVHINWPDVWKSVTLQVGLILSVFLVPLIWIEVSTYRRFLRESKKKRSIK